MSLDVRAARKRLGLTQKQLAVKIDASEREVARWERRDVTKRVTPIPFYVRAIKKLVYLKELGEQQERPTPAPPTVRRQLPGTTPGIGIAPSSY